MIAEPVAVADEVGLSGQRLRRIDALMQTFVERGVVSGAVTLVARKGHIAHLVAHGDMDLAAHKPMQADALFRLASMTKPVISVAVLTLLEEGKLLLSDPVSAFLPTFRGQQVAVPNLPVPAWVSSTLETGGFHLEPAQREITVRDLLTHTSGLGSAMVGPCANETLAVASSIRAGEALAEVIPRMGATPLSFQPGCVWEYSPGFGFDTLARIVEVVSGQPIDQYLQQRIFEPLRMPDTTFSVPLNTTSRLATVYERGPNGLQPATTIRMLSLALDPDNRYYSGGGGLVGTAEDYGHFAMMLANGGQSPDGERVLGRKTVRLMASNHIGQLPWDRPVGGDLRGYRFGLGVRVLEDPGAAASPASPGTFGWAGAFGTNSFIDPVEHMVGIMLIQRSMDPNDGELRSLWPRFQNTAYQAIDD